MTDTAQQRAEAVVAEMINGPTHLWMCGGQTSKLVKAFVRHEQQARREALEEAVKVVSIYNCYHNHGKKATKACDDIVELLDRLREEV